MAARTLSGPARRELVDAVRVRYRISTPNGEEADPAGVRSDQRLSPQVGDPYSER